MAAQVVGGHPIYPKPQGACGSFSFKGNGNDLYFIWTVPGAGMMVAWIRSLQQGFAVVTFHPAAIIHNNNQAQYHMWLQVQLGALPHLEIFRVEQPGHIVVNPVNPLVYQLPFGLPYRFYILGHLWEEWDLQQQMWRKAVFGNVGDHNV
jgi:hypothetical protein